MSHKKVQVLTETIKRLIQCRADENLKNILAKSHFADIAYVLGQVSLETQAFLFGLLPSPTHKAEVLSELALNQVAPLVEHLGIEASANILSHVSPDDVADILEELPKEFSASILVRLKKEEAEEVQELIRYSSDTAGGIMSPDVFALPEELTVAKAIERVQQSSDVETVFYVYVVNVQDQLVGVLSLKKLLRASPGALLRDIMDKDPLRVRHDEDQEEVARMVSRYNYLSLPVIDETNKLVGIITVDDIIDVIREEAKEDILLMSGANAQVGEDTSFWGRLRGRSTWFIISLIAGIFNSEIIAVYYPEPTAFRLLVGFIPFLLGVTASISIQSMAIVVSSITGGGMGLPQVVKMMRKEFLAACVFGAVFGLLVVGYLALRYPMLDGLPQAVGLALTTTLLMATLIGTLLPLLFQKIGIDPAIATGPFITAFVHLFTLWIYFAFGTTFTTL